MSKKKKIIYLIILIIGIIVLSYPFVSNYVKQKNQTDIISQYEEEITNLSNDDIKKIRQEAEDYNNRLSGNTQNVSSNKSYVDLLNIGDVIGYVIIPKIDVKLPIYHGTQEEVLQKGVGHLETSSLPIGGKSTHSVLTGHRGLPSSKLFTDLDKIEIGDVFFINVLGEYISYRVYDISVVLPSDTSLLSIEKDKDLCTLITCTPYMINSHRLLVRGERSDDTYSEEQKYDKEEVTTTTSLNEKDGYLPIIENTNQFIIIYFAAFGIFVSIIYLIYYTFNIINLIKNSKEIEEMLNDNNTPIMIDEENGVEEITESQRSFTPVEEKEAMDFVEESNNHERIIPNSHQYEEPIGPMPLITEEKEQTEVETEETDAHEISPSDVTETEEDFINTKEDETPKHFNTLDTITPETDEDISEKNKENPVTHARVQEYEYKEKVPFNVVEVLKNNKKTIINAALISSAIVGLYILFKRKNKK